MSNRAILTVLALTLLLVSCGQPAPTTRHPVTTTPPVVPVKVAVIGDSYTGGSGVGGVGVRGWPALTWEKLRKEGIPVAPVVGALPGSGYVHRGSQGGGVFGEQVPKLVTADTRLVVFFNGVNDVNEAVDEVHAAALSDFQAAKQIAPQAKLLVIGPAWPNSARPSNLLALRDTIKDAATEAGATWVDPVAEGWFTDTPQLIGEDGVHPTDDGHTYLADRIEPHIREELSKP